MQPLSIGLKSRPHEQFFFIFLFNKMFLYFYFKSFCFKIKCVKCIICKVTYNTYIHAAILCVAKVDYRGAAAPKKGWISGLQRYSVMQSDGNSWKICTFQETITSELMISYLF